MKESNFIVWYRDNREFLENNNIKQEIAEIIWNSAKTSAIHDMLSAVQDGSLNVQITF